MRIASGAAALFTLGAVFSTPGQAGGPQGPWSGFYLGIAFGIADVDSDVKLSATSATTTWNTCDTITNGTAAQPSAACAPGNGPDLFPPPIGPIPTPSLPFNVVDLPLVEQLSSLSSGDVGWLGMTFVGVDQKIAQSLVVGAFADLSVTGEDSSFAATGPLATISGKLDFDYLATVGGRLGWIVPNGNGLLYVYGGYTYAGAGDSEATVTTGQGSTKVRFDDFEGFSVGGGGEAQLGGGWFARLEYRYTNLNSQKFGFSHVGSETKTAIPGATFGACTSTNPPTGLDCQKFDHSQTTTNGSAEVDPDIHSVRMALGYKF